MHPALQAWTRLSRIPLGSRLFTRLFTIKTPYAATIRPQFAVLEPNRVELVVRDRRRVRNHVGTVHAVALCNGLETAAGTLAEVTVPRDRRWIPKGMEVAYAAKAVGDVRCVAETDPSQWATDDPDLHVRVRGTLADGTVAIEGVIRLWVTPRQDGRPRTTSRPTSGQGPHPG